MPLFEESRHVGLLALIELCLVLHPLNAGEHALRPVGIALGGWRRFWIV